MTDALTVGDAVTLCRTRRDAQLARAVEERAAPNVAVQGDGQFRSLFLVLLPEDEQRRFFLETARDTKAWPRLSSLFGAPPFHFLRAEDAGMLRAAGFARGRANMTYEHGSGGMIVPSSAQFGAHFEDAHDRAYRLLASPEERFQPRGGLLRGDEAELASIALLESLPTGLQLHVAVKVKRRSQREKQRMIINERERESLTFPRPGTRVQLFETAQLTMFTQQARGGERIERIVAEKSADLLGKRARDAAPKDADVSQKPGDTQGASSSAPAQATPDSAPDAKATPAQKLPTARLSTMVTVRAVAPRGQRGNTAILVVTRA